MKTDLANEQDKQGRKLISAASRLKIKVLLTIKF